MTTALLIIDVQNAILDGKGTPERQPAILAALEGVVARLATILAKARSAALPVIIVQHDGDPGHRLETGTVGWQVRLELVPQTGEILVRKRFSDSFYQTDLQTQLQTLGVDHLIIGGCMTQFCVDTTVRSALSHGYDVTLLSDGHTTADAGDLTFDQIIAHHNATLDGFDAGTKSVTLKPCGEVAFSDKDSI